MYCKTFVSCLFDNFIAYTSLANFAWRFILFVAAWYPFPFDQIGENSGNFAVAMLKASLGADDTWQQRAEVPDGLHTFAWLVCLLCWHLYLSCDAGIIRSCVCVCVCVFCYVYGICILLFCYVTYVVSTHYFLVLRSQILAFGVAQNLLYL